MSMLGIFLFMIPISWKGDVSIPVALVANWVEGTIAETLPYISVFFLLVTGMLSLIAKVAKPSFIANNAYLKGLFDVGPFWLTARVLGMFFALTTLFQIGPEIFWADDAFGLVTFLTVIFLFAGSLLPLLLDFGLLELVGVLMTKVMRPLFTLPGRSAIDCLTSWLGDGTVGVLLTSKQYEEGYYTQREAAVIGTTFSLVSITFSIVIIGYVGLEHLFVPFYLTIVVAGVIAALIMPRIPPLSRKPDTYYEAASQQNSEVVPENMSLFQWGMRQAASRAKQSSVATVAQKGMRNVVDMWVGVLPFVMALAALANIIAEHTPVFKFIGAVFIPILSLLNVPEASAAAQTVIVGFADMFLPVVIAKKTIANEFTLFVIACLSVTQLIYMSEVGALLLGSKIPVNFKDLVIIFFERTLLTLPIIVLMAYLLL
ncbi:YjiH family protein [Numidum massiliense]|uniref:YjiH family protein n=1 Tax=Numidum massiliense TaxID=1522315 RepID=UPI0006D53C60|nr:YjiH family protein [Numidum massiliense]